MASTDDEETRARARATDTDARTHAPTHPPRTHAHQYFKGGAKDPAGLDLLSGSTLYTHANARVRQQQRTVAPIKES